MSTRVVHSLAITLTVSCSLLYAQFTLRSTINGRVTDSSGAVVPNAPVVLTDLDRNQTYKTTSNAEGIYSFTNLTPGRYRASVESPGFRKTVSNDIEVVSQQVARADLTLQIGNIAETVEVTGIAPLIIQEQSVVGQVLPKTAIESLPIRGHNFMSYITLAPNISGTTRANAGDTWGVGAQDVVGGANFTPGGGGNKGFYMNGVNINDNYVGWVSYAPSAEAVSEVKIDTANFSAANGRDVATYNVSTRGGTSQFHGAAFDFFQNSQLNAWNPYAKSRLPVGAKKSLLQRNQFGGNFGGPVIIPKVYNGREKLFFFANYERMIQNTAASDVTARVPTAAQRTGDFSDLLTRFPGDPNYVFWNPFSTVIDARGNSKRTPVPNNDLRAIGGIDPSARQLVDIFPLPNGYVNPQNANDLNNFRTSQSRGTYSWRLDSRVDYRPSDNDNVYVGFSKSGGWDDNRGGVFPELASNHIDKSYLVNVNYVRVFGPALANEFLFSYGKGRLDSLNDAALAYLHQADTLRNKFFNNLGSGVDFGLNQIAMGSGYPSIGPREYWWDENPSLGFSDNLSWVKRNHSLKLGFSFLRKKEVDYEYWRGVSFDRTFTRAGSLDGLLGGDSVASLLLGIPTSMQTRYKFEQEPARDFVMPYWGFYAEDKWQLTPKLTLNFGLRYDLPIPTYSSIAYGFAVMDYNYPGWQVAQPGRADGFPLHYVTADKNNLAPRISLAYRLKPDFVVRASYGIFYDSGMNLSGSLLLDNGMDTVPALYGDIYNNARFQVHDDIPYFKFSDIFPAPLSMDLDAFPIKTGKGTGYYDFNKYFRYSDQESGVTPYYQRYLVEFQKGLGASTAVSFTYLGGRGVKLPYYEDRNAPAYRTGWPSTAAFNAARPNANGRFADVKVLRHGFNSFYNAATVKIERRFSHGWQLLAHYTFSKTVTDFSGMRTNPGADGNGNEWAWNRLLGRGEASFSHPHRFIMATIYETPWGRSLARVPRAMLWGWKLSVTTTFESGDSGNVVNGQTNARDWEPQVPNLSGNPNLARGERTFYRFFDTTVFSAPLQDVKGNAGVGIIRGPGINNWDTSMSKMFHVTEKSLLEFRAELFNAFNHTQWSNINRTYSTARTSTFGWVTAAREGRIAQLSLKLSF